MLNYQWVKSSLHHWKLQQKHGNPLLFRFFQMPMLLICGEIRCACSPEEGTVVGVLPDRAGSAQKMGHGAAYSHENP